MVENVTWKFQKLNFTSSFHQYSSSCEEYFGGEEFNFEEFLSTFPIQKNYWIKQNLNKFGTGSGWSFFSFFPMYYLQKPSANFLGAIVVKSPA